MTQPSTYKGAPRKPTTGNCKRNVTLNSIVKNWVFISGCGWSFSAEFWRFVSQLAFGCLRPLLLCCQASLTHEASATRQINLANCRNLLCQTFPRMLEQEEDENEANICSKRDCIFWNGVSIYFPVESPIPQWLRRILHSGPASSLFRLPSAGSGLITGLDAEFTQRATRPRAPGGNANDCVADFFVPHWRSSSSLHTSALLNWGLLWHCMRFCKLPTCKWFLL